MDTIVAEQLRKRYGRNEVLHGIDLRVPPGSLYGFLGPNGAGKSTTLRILVGLLRANGGRATIGAARSLADLVEMARICGAYEP